MNNRTSIVLMWVIILFLFISGMHIVIFHKKFIWSEFALIITLIVILMFTVILTIYYSENIKYFIKLKKIEKEIEEEKNKKGEK